MDTQKFDALINVVKCGSLTSAAKELGYTQPGLTNMMNSIEDELGIALLIRSKSGIKLSPYGEELMPEIQKVLDATESLNEAVMRVRNKSYSSLKIAAFASIARTWLPDIMQEFISSLPDIDLSASMQDIEIMYTAVKNDTLDCAIVSYNESMLGSLYWIPLADDQFVAVTPKDAYPGVSTFPMDQFAGSPFLMPSGGFDMDIIPLFDDRTTPSSIRYTNMDDPTIVSMVERGLGLTIMSDLIMKSMTSKVDSLPLDPSRFRTLGIIVKEKRRHERAVKAFIAAAEKIVEQYYK